MNIPKKIIVLGTGGNSIDILDTINEINLIEKKYECIGFLDDDVSKRSNQIHGVDIIGQITDAKFFKDAYFINGIGNSSNFYSKKIIIAKSSIRPDKFETIIHPLCLIPLLSRTGSGIAMPMAMASLTSTRALCPDLSHSNIASIAIE